MFFNKGFHGLSGFPNFARLPSSGQDVVLVSFWVPLGFLLASLFGPLGRPNRPKFGPRRLKKVGSETVLDSVFFVLKHRLRFCVVWGSFWDRFWLPLAPPNASLLAPCWRSKSIKRSIQNRTALKFAPRSPLERSVGKLPPAVREEREEKRRRERAREREEEKRREERRGEERRREREREEKRREERRKRKRREDREREREREQEKRENKRTLGGHLGMISGRFGGS